MKTLESNPSSEVRPEISESQDAREAFGRRIDVLEHELAPNEVRLAQVNRVAILGELCAELANEMNNPLAVVSGYAGQLRKKADAGSESERQLARISEAADRISKILTSLQRLSSPHSPRRELFSIQSALRTAIDLSQPLFRSVPITLAVDLAAEPFHCVGDADLFVQAVMNLISNARDAIVSAGRKVGKIGIALEASSGETFTISVSDNGTGMDALTRRRAFLPFFSTKAPEKAVGVGLTTARQAAHDFGGELRCETAAGAGSTFRLTLPRARATR